MPVNGYAIDFFELLRVASRTWADDGDLPTCFVESLGFLPNPAIEGAAEISTILMTPGSFSSRERQIVRTNLLAGEWQLQIVLRVGDNPRS